MMGSRIPTRSRCRARSSDSGTSATRRSSPRPKAFPAASRAAAAGGAGLDLVEVEADDAAIGEPDGAFGDEGRLGDSVACDADGEGDLRGAAGGCPPLPDRPAAVKGEALWMGRADERAQGEDDAPSSRAAAGGQAELNGLPRQAPAVGRGVPCDPERTVRSLNADEGDGARGRHD